MTDSTDPYRHHPNLRGKIKDPMTSFFRSFDIFELMANEPNSGLSIKGIYSNEVREYQRRQFLERSMSRDLYVFAYGSLMWDPAFIYKEVRKGRALGYERRFILKDESGGRGTEDRPGVMAALDKGSSCDGLLFKIDRTLIDQETEILWRREMVAPAYIPRFIDVITGDEKVKALTFVADHNTPVIRSELSFDDQVHLLQTGQGIWGSSLEYLTNIAEHFEMLGVKDAHVEELMNATKRSANV